MSKYYAIVVREDGKLLGRLTPDGTATNRNIYAAMLNRETADRVADEINQAGEFTAKVIKF